MNRTGVVTALLGVISLGVVSYVALRSRTATLTWNYDYQKYPPCSSSVAANSRSGQCLLGFKVFLGTPDNRKNQQSVPNRFDQNGQIISQNITWTLPVRPYGNVQFCVVSVAAYENGQTQESQPACTTRRVLPFGLGKK